MPVYEYKCESCKKVFEELIRNNDTENDLKCPYCGSREFRKLMSSYSAFGSSRDSVDSFDTGSSCPSCGCDGGSCGY